MSQLNLNLTQKRANTPIPFHVSAWIIHNIFHISQTVVVITWDILLNDIWSQCTSQTLIVLFFRYMFFTDMGTSSKPNSAKIERAFMDGSHRNVFHLTKVLAPRSIAVDIEGQRVYWIDAHLDHLDTVDYNGLNRWNITMPMGYGTLLWRCWSSLCRLCNQDLPVFIITYCTFLVQLNLIIPVYSSISEASDGCQLTSILCLSYIAHF